MYNDDMSSFKRQVLPYAIVVLFGYIGFSMPLPMLPEMILGEGRSLLPVTYSIGKKTFLLGLLMASYPLGQLFGAPLFGRLSDHLGRKRTILFTLFGTALGYVIAASSTMAGYFGGIFLGLLLCGFFEGNVAIAQSVIADISDGAPREQKSFHFGWINLFISLGFIIGPFLGGQLSDPNTVSWFSFATPFWVGSIMAIASAGMISFWASETRLAKPMVKEKFWDSILMSFRIKELRPLYAANFFLALGFYSYFRFLPVYLERTYNFSTVQLAYAMIFTSVMLATSLLVVNKYISRHFTPISATRIFAFLLAIMLVVVVLPPSPYFLLATVPPIGVLLAITITNGCVMISDHASKDLQGAAMGSLTSIQVLAELITAIMGGYFAGRLPAMPLYIGAMMALVCCIILFSVKIAQKIKE